jgi:hypothetical protein
MATGGGQISLPWPLGWIVATLSGRIFFLSWKGAGDERWGWRLFTRVGGGWPFEFIWFMD